MKSQKIGNKEPKKHVMVVDERKRNIDEVKPTSDKPLIVVNYVEVGDMDPKQVQLMVQEISASFNRKQFANHYLLPVRNGKIGTDMVFEEEWLKAVRDTCEVVGSEIKLKRDAVDLEIVRRKI